MGSTEKAFELSANKKNEKDKLVSDAKTIYENGIEVKDHNFQKLNSEKNDSEESQESEDVIGNGSQSGNLSKKATPSVDIQKARGHRDSESSNTNGDSPSVDSMKRQRTVSGSSPVQNFIFPGVAASPPKFMTLEEVMKAANGVSNMVLAHEIAVDRNFKLEKFEPPENSLEKRVRDTMHRAFWDNLSEQLREDPPNYDQAFVLLQEVCDHLTEITLPHHTRLRQEIKDKFDVELIKQQAQHGVLNFQEYSEYVLTIMSRLCAPVRDDVIRDLLAEKNDVVKVFRGVMETLDLMRLDMANFTIQQIRPHIIAQSVEYERKKFAEFLKTQNDGLELTRAWLTEFVTDEDVDATSDEEAASQTALNASVKKVISRAYLSMLSWPDEKPLPETVLLDGGRLLELRDRLMQVCVMGSVLLVAQSAIAASVPPEPDLLKLTLKKNICSILDTAYTQKETYAMMGNLSEQVAEDVCRHLSSHGRSPLTAAAVSALKAQIAEIEKPQQRIRQLITTRAHEFIGELLSNTTPPSSAGGPSVAVPPGLSTLREELAHICASLLRLVSHNRAVFGDYYSEIIANHMKSVKVLRKEKELQNATQNGELLQS